jgi:hypothetical protein
MRSTGHGDGQRTFKHRCDAGDLFMESAMGRYGLRNAEDKQTIALLRLPCDG